MKKAKQDLENYFKKKSKKIKRKRKINKINKLIVSILIFIIILIIGLIIFLIIKFDGINKANYNKKSGYLGILKSKNLKKGKERS